MSLYLRWTCDACGAKEEELPSNGYSSTTRPKGWYRIDGRDLCSRSCLATFANDPDSVPAMAWLPDPMAEVFKRALGKKTPKAEATSPPPATV